SVVKNRNYKVKIPNFLVGDEESYGTILNYEHTVKITIDELLHFLKSEKLDNKDFMVFSFIKSLCSKSYTNGYTIPMRRIYDDMNMSSTSLNSAIKKLKRLGIIHVSHGSWSKITSDMSPAEISSKCVANTYYIKEIKST